MVEQGLVINLVSRAQIHHCGFHPGSQRPLHGFLDGMSVVLPRQQQHRRLGGKAQHPQTAGGKGALAVLVLQRQGEVIAGMCGRQKQRLENRFPGLLVEPPHGQFGYHFQFGDGAND